MFIIFEETSTLLKNGGMHWSPKMSHQFQHAVVSIQVAREDQAIEWARMIAQHSLKKKAVVIYDRGLCDGYAFVEPSLMKEAAERVGIDDRELFSRYDCVFHLTTAADGAEKFYKLTDYRHETIEEAIKQDQKLQEVWSEHPNHFVFPNGQPFAAKIESVIGRLCDCLGIQQMKKHPRRFLLKSWPVVPEGLPVIREIFVKTYIDVPSNEPGHVCSFVRKSERIGHSKKEHGGTYVLKQIVKKEDQLITRKNIITKDKYNFWLKVQDQTRHQVVQTRMFLSVPDKGMLELVQYEKPRKGLILCNVYEVAESNFEFDGSLPLKIDVVKEVTGEEEFSAHSISTKDIEI